ncbi:hypothetical protein P8452_29020 [Trifolium repens]|nr:hypothetical protein P8452_29020 [Trifolium repens]
MSQIVWLHPQPCSIPSLIFFLYLSSSLYSYSICHRASLLPFPITHHSVSSSPLQFFLQHLRRSLLQFCTPRPRFGCFHD